MEERNIEGLCGYPCCERQLGVVPQQKYHISVQRKLVLDLTERKVSWLFGARHFTGGSGTEQDTPIRYQ